MKTLTLFFAALALCFSMLLSGCSSQRESSTTPSPSATPASPSPTVTEEAPVLIYADQLSDGSYEITVDSSASMFRVVHCILHVESGTMTATMTMSGQGYGMVYMGTREEAAEDSEDTYIPFVLDETGAKTFTVPVEALNLETDCAAWSIRKKKWYDRVLVFESDGLPAEAFQVG